MGSKIIDDAFKRVNTKAFKEKMQKQRREYKESLTSEYQLGFYVGEDIIRRFLPTTSVDMICTNKRISTTLGGFSLELFSSCANRSV